MHTDWVKHLIRGFERSNFISHDIYEMSWKNCDGNYVRLTTQNIQNKHNKNEVFDLYNLSKKHYIIPINKA